MISGKLTNFDVFRNLGEDFVGREAELLEIRKQFSGASSKKPRVLVVHGPAGQGKSQLALEFCRQSQKMYRAIFWVNASSDMTAIHAFETIATELGLASSEDLLDAGAKIRAVRKTLESWDERWLMVIDNYDWPDRFPDVKRLIPSRTEYRPPVMTWIF